MGSSRWIGILAVLTALVGPLASATSRPPQPEASSPFASPVAETRQVEGQVEGAAFIASLPPELQTRLAAERRLLLPEDRTVGDNMAGYIRAVVLFNQPKQRVFDLITDPSTQVLFLPRLKVSTPIDRQPVGELTEFHVAAGLFTVKFRTQHWWWPDRTRMEWALDPAYDNDVKVASGFWQVFALDEKTSVGEYGTVVDIGLPVPDALQGYLTRKDMPAALDAFQKYIESGGTWRRPE